MKQHSPVSLSAWYGKVKPRVCTPNPTPQVLQQQVMYKPRKQNPAKVKARATATQEDDKECHKILQRHDSYHTKVRLKRSARAVRAQCNYLGV